MSCAEVMEWMHRYLDHDLSQDEILEMFRHIDNCPSCAEVFDSLSTLSKSLEQMPDVKPPFSLVDSILPKLAELDRGLHQPSTIKAEDHPRDEQVVVPFSRKVSHKKPARGHSMARRTGIGAAAAAVILGIAIFYAPPKMPSAEVDQLLNRSADKALSNNAAVGDSSESSFKSAEVGTTEGDDKGANSSESASTFGATDVTAQDGGGAADPSQDAAPSATQSATPGGGAAPAPVKTKEPVRTEKPKKNSRVTTPTPKASVPTDQLKVQRDLTNDTEGFDQGMQDSVSSAGEGAPSPGEAGDTAMGLLPPSSALNAAAPQATWTSPDGLHKAELAGQQLVIYSLAAGESGGEQAVTSLPLEGTWVSGEWSPDGTQFTYVTSQQGTNVTKTFTVEPAGSPVAPSASPTPQPSATPTGT
ncbi:zf-HC2 domain-containing protein [Paenibacillus agri]|uniref:Anti-sigma-W factor RsiW n=1 Tax=Paenibacillus agri TaxID=2744309 RepID=A0A850EMJ3_9BACL|nr:zf-HC2 domain-containing protein [Paenibacillus agri]NUU62318.1 zf-HC2 domain-containing protein [Paenibacillus agri]